MSHSIWSFYQHPEDLEGNQDQFTAFQVILSGLAQSDEATFSRVGNSK
jgi:hypothetical protein